MQLLQIHFAQNLPILPAFCSLLLPTYFSKFFAGRIDASLHVKCTHMGDFPKFSDIFTESHSINFKFPRGMPQTSQVGMFCILMYFANLVSSITWDQHFYVAPVCGWPQILVQFQHVKFIVANCDTFQGSAQCVLTILVSAQLLTIIQEFVCS